MGILRLIDYRNPQWWKKRVLDLFGVFFLYCFLSSTVARASDFVDCDQVRTNETACMACNIYHEARGEHDAGKIAVGLVTVNRANSPAYPDTICGVVWDQRYSKRTGRLTAMFSWTLDGKSDVADELESWNDAVNLAKLMMEHYNPANPLFIAINGMCGDELWYHNDNVHPVWANYKVMTQRVGRHLFYSQRGC